MLTKKGRPKNKVVSFQRAIQISREAGKKKKKVGFATGVFDILHMGHVLFLKSIKKKVDLLIVGVDDNSTSTKIKGNEQPFFDETERTHLLTELAFVDYTFVFKGPCSSKILKKIQPTYYGISPFDPVLEKKRRDAKEARVKLFISPEFLKSHSSSQVGRTIRYGYLLSKTRDLDRKEWTN